MTRPHFSISFSEEKVEDKMSQIGLILICALLCAIIAQHEVSSGSGGTHNSGHKSGHMSGGKSGHKSGHMSGGKSGHKSGHKSKPNYIHPEYTSKILSGKSIKYQKYDYGFCRSPSTLYFDFKESGLGASLDGYFALANDAHDMKTLKTVIAGDSSSSMQSSSSGKSGKDPLPNIVLTVDTHESDGPVHKLTGFGDNSASVQCTKSNLHLTGKMCVSVLGKSDYDFTPYIVHTDNDVYALIVRCYRNGSSGWTLFSKSNAPLNKGQKKKLKAIAKTLGFKKGGMYFDDFSDYKST